MNRKEIQELRELADGIEADGAWALHNDATVTAALRACADEKERAQAGITDAVIETACRALCVHYHWDPDEPVTYSGTRKKARDPDGHVVLQWEMHVPEARIFLQSAALALQGGREKLRALANQLNAATFKVLKVSGSAFLAGEECRPADRENCYTLLCEANNVVSSVADDLSRAIGDEK